LALYFAIQSTFENKGGNKMENAGKKSGCGACFINAVYICDTGNRAAFEKLMRVIDILIIPCGTGPMEEKHLLSAAVKAGVHTEFAADGNSINPRWFLFRHSVGIAVCPGSRGENNLYHKLIEMEDDFRFLGSAFETTIRALTKLQKRVHGRAGHA
jgi:hypothetical protein